MREHHDLMAATSETIGKRVRGSLDAAALQARNRQAVAECGNPQAGHAGWHAHVPSGLRRLQRAGALRDRQVAAAGSQHSKAHRGFAASGDARSQSAPARARAACPSRARRLVSETRRRKCRRERVDIVRSDEQPAGFIDDLQRAAERGRHDRQARALRLDKRDTKRFRTNIWLAVDVGSLQERGHVVALPGEAYAIVQCHDAARFPSARGSTARRSRAVVRRQSSISSRPRRAASPWLQALHDSPSMTPAGRPERSRDRRVTCRATGGCPLVSGGLAHRAAWSLSG